MQTSYQDLAQSISAVIEGINDAQARMATISSMVYAYDDRYDWVGFYRNIGKNQLLIGPYQGGLGCLEISFSKGVCGACAREKKVQLVSNVDLFPGHIACSATTKSELVLPVLNKNDELLAVFDIDSNLQNAFTKNDINLLQPIINSTFADFTLSDFYK